MENKNLIKTDFSIQSFKGGFDNNFSYLVTCMRSGIEIIIDASLKLDRLKPFFKSNPAMILITHTHTDHIQYISSYLECFPNLKIIGHPDSNNNFEYSFFSIFSGCIIQSTVNFPISSHPAYSKSIKYILFLLFSSYIPRHFLPTSVTIKTIIRMVEEQVVATSKCLDLILFLSTK